ncbi:hypothetical protein Q5752_000411 [Cryptotrichosporon argae]
MNNNRNTGILNDSLHLSGATGMTAETGASAASSDGEFNVCDYMAMLVATKADSQADAISLAELRTIWRATGGTATGKLFRPPRTVVVLPVPGAPRHYHVAAVVDEQTIKTVLDAALESALDALASEKPGESSGPSESEGRVLHEWKGKTADGVCVTVSFRKWLAQR